MTDIHRVAEVMALVDAYALAEDGSNREGIEKAIIAIVQDCEEWQFQRDSAIVRMREQDLQLDALKARVAELQARNSKLVQILAGIHELLNPPLIEHDGKTFKFVNPDANDVLEELSSRIRAIPDSIDALPNEQGGHIARLEKDAARYRWLKLQPWNMWGPNVVRGPRYEHVGNLDATIDAAMAASKEAS